MGLRLPSLRKAVRRALALTKGVVAWGEKTNALKMERISHEENSEAHVGSKMGFG
jgi:hypothetical protein